MRQEMNGLDFLNRIEARNLIPAGPVEQVRAKLLASPTPVRATKVAKMLVDLGHLTMFQARQLIREYEREADERMRESEIESASQANSASLEFEDNEDLQLAPIEDDVAPANQAPPAPSLSGTVEPTSELDFEDSSPDLISESPQPLADAPAPTRDDTETTVDDPFSFSEDGDLPDDTPRKRRIGGRRRNQWDTPLILVGGGVLIALSSLGIVLYLFLQRDTGDQLLTIADDHYRSGSYAQAIPNYERFLEKFPNHPDVSQARVRQGLANLRRTTETQPDFRQVLQKARSILANIENEPRFTESRKELATIIPEIAEGLAAQAQKSEDIATTKELVEQTRAALSLAANTKYVPASLRPEVRLQRIEETVALSMREIEQAEALEAALAKMRSAVTSGQPQAAYQARVELLEAFPTLQGNDALEAVMRSAVETEAASIQHISETREAISEERPATIAGSLALAHRRGPSQVEDQGGQLFVRVAGALYALSATNGQLLWRRAVGHDASAHPLDVAASAPDQVDVLCVDSLHQDLLRLDGRSGKLQWRQPFDSVALQLTLAGDRLYVATDSGGVHALDVQSGQQLHQAVLPQPVEVAPAVSASGTQLFVVGAENNLYVFSSPDLAAEEVVYLGHGRGTIQVAPAVVRSVVVVAENWATENSRLLVLQPNDSDGKLELAQKVRLDGHVVTPPVVAGKLLVVTTNSGDTRVFDVGGEAGDTGNPLRPIADLPPEQRSPVARHLLADNNQLWLASDKLARYGINQAAGRLTLEPLPQTFEGQVVDDPLSLDQGLLALIHHDQQRPTTTVTALAHDSGRIIWQTDVAIRPIGSPRIDTEKKQIDQVTADGSLFRFDDEALRALVQDLPTVTVPGASASLTEMLDIGPQRAVFVGPVDSQSIVAYDAQQDGQPLQSHRFDGQLAGPIAVLGNDLLIPLRDGRILVVDPSNGRPTAEPFQPPLAPGEKVTWESITTFAGDEAEGVLASTGTQLYRLGVKPTPTRHLAVEVEIGGLAPPMTSDLASLRDRVFAVDATGTLQAFRLEDLQPQGVIPLDGQAIWGPWAGEEQLLVATERSELIAVNGAGSLLWRIPLAYGPPVGDPLIHQGSAIFSTVTGAVWRVDLSNGQEIAVIKTGQQLASGPVVFRTRLLAAARDGAILVLRLPE